MNTDTRKWYVVRGPDGTLHRFGTAEGARRKFEALYPRAKEQPGWFPQPRQGERK